MLKSEWKKILYKKNKLFVNNTGIRSQNNITRLGESS